MATLKESAARGQTIVTDGAPDKSSHKVNDKEARYGKLSGSGTDTSAATKAGAYANESKKGNIPL